MLRRVAWYTFANVSEVLAAAIIRMIIPENNNLCI
jgi:hypothetical protein